MSDEHEVVERDTVENERAVIGAMLCDKTAFEQYGGVLNYEDFTGQVRRAIVRAITSLHDSGAPVDGIAIWSAAKQLGDPVSLQDIGVQIDEWTATASVEHHLDLVRAAASKDRARAVALAMLKQDNPISGDEAAKRLLALDAAQTSKGWAKYDAGINEFLARNYERPVSIVGNGLLARGDLAILFGEGGLGKSYLAIQLLLCACRADSWLGLAPPERPMRCGFFGLELSGWHLQERLRHLLGVESTDGLPFYAISMSDIHARPNLLESNGVNDAIAWARARNLDIMVLDAMSRFHDGNETEDGPRITAAADRIRMQSGAAVLFVHHERKAPGGSGSDSDKDALRGHTKFRDDPTCLMRLVKDKSGLLQLRFIKANNADEPKPIFLSKDPSGHGFHVTQSPSSKSDASRERIIQVLRENPQGIGRNSIERITGYARATVWRHLKAIGAENVGTESNPVYRFAFHAVSDGGETVEENNGF